MRRSVLLPTALLACTIVGFTAATVIGASDPAPQPHGILEPGQLAGIAGTDAIERTAADPKATGRDWAVTAFKAKNGQTCVAAGRKQGDKVGVNAKDGSFVPYPIEDGATCVDLGVVPAGAQMTSSPSEGRTTIHGVAGPKVRQINLSVNNISSELATGPRGAFLAVFGPEVDPATVKVSATLKNGSVVALLGD